MAQRHSLICLHNLAHMQDFLLLKTKIFQNDLAGVESLIEQHLDAMLDGYDPTDMTILYKLVSMIANRSAALRVLVGRVQRIIKVIAVPVKKPLVV